MCWGVCKFPTKLILCPFNGWPQARSWALGDGSLPPGEGCLPASRAETPSPAQCGHQTVLEAAWLPGGWGWGEIPGLKGWAVIAWLPVGAYIMPK